MLDNCLADTQSVLNPMLLIHFQIRCLFQNWFHTIFLNCLLTQQSFTLRSFMFNQGKDFIQLPSNCTLPSIYPLCNQYTYIIYSTTCLWTLQSLIGFLSRSFIWYLLLNQSWYCFFCNILCTMLSWNKLCIIQMTNSLLRYGLLHSICIWLKMNMSLMICFR